MSGSPGDVQPVLDAVAERAALLCESPYARVLVVEGNHLRPFATYSIDGTPHAPTVPLPLKRSSIAGRAAVDCTTIHHEDVVPLLETEYPDSVNAKRLGFRAVLGVPLMREDQAIVQVPSRAMQMHGDPVRLTQVLGNLLDNASKYTPEGGEIRLSADVSGELLTVTVSDSGIGISVDALPHVFEPFVQHPHAIEFNGSGLGIGLTVVLELVQAHGGTVVASSAGPGRGSGFVVTLPLLPQTDSE